MIYVQFTTVLTVTLSNISSRLLSLHAPLSTAAILVLLIISSFRASCALSASNQICLAILNRYAEQVCLLDRYSEQIYSDPSTPESSIFPYFRVSMPSKYAWFTFLSKYAWILLCQNAWSFSDWHLSRKAS